MLLVYEKITGKIQAKFSNDQNVESIYQNNPDALERLAGIYVPDEDIPKDNINTYKIVDSNIIKMTINEIDNMTFKNPSQVKIEKLQAENNNFKQLLNLLPPSTNPTTLEDFKQNKIYEVNVACNQTILGGFKSSCTGTEYFYKFDMEYQGNLSQQGIILMMDTTMDMIPWPTSNSGVIIHNRVQFIQLCKDAQDWKSSNIYRYFTMKAQIEMCATVAEINNFVW